jgi:hypothetical protein
MLAKGIAEDDALSVWAGEEEGAPVGGTLGICAGEETCRNAQNPKSSRTLTILRNEFAYVCLSVCLFPVSSEHLD